MSLINKMLQDLDARGGTPQTSGLSSSVQAVSQEGTRHRSLVLILVVFGAVLLTVAALFAGWRYWSALRTADKPVRPQAIVNQAPAVEKPQATPPEQMVDGLPPPAPENVPAVAPPKVESVAPVATSAEARRPARARSSASPSSPRMQPAARPALAAGGTVSPASREPGAQASATALFQRAQQKLMEARVTEAIADLEHALEIDPRYLAARETLIAVLLENGRQRNAMAHLQRALASNPEQSQMAMLLARLQLESGSDAIGTLERSLPYAQSNADYRAMMAGVLERINRHREAAEHYRAAVQLQPANGVWWMGLGIALQAEQRNAEAKAAFQRALETGRLAPELQAFVERRLQQLN
ncbi:MSHA biogenesis protein MshN [Duganella sp. CF458]|uniref:tetratricopeptide repeat protein n=1 Tax=Duganella sp. CF458 TaxID=1884368 RepID=UPI0008E62C80|nr:tetratricopeptide repeat protein [Duganella sp. CF458]SFG63377.1 MSHA biogenesis protein MshN [Duganella sp. CF458]